MKGRTDMKNELFVVKSGENKGVYLKVSNIIPEETQCKILGWQGLGAGRISANRVNFYKRHGAATNKTLQSMDTSKQIATIWRLNPYGINNEWVLEHMGEKLQSIKENFDHMVKTLRLQNLFN